MCETAPLLHLMGLLVCVSRATRKEDSGVGHKILILADWLSRALTVRRRHGQKS